MEVYLDGGIRNGIDIFKALALGAKAVFIGRPILWGLAYKVGTSFLKYYHLTLNFVELQHTYLL